MASLRGATAMRSFLSLLTLCVVVSAARAARPNVLWITCEDMSPTLGCFGDPYARTPHLDELAKRSVRYTHAFSVAGVCAPSRSCLITGMYPSSLGTHHMRCTGKLPPQVTCFTEPLRQAGYYCTNNVKTDYNFKPPTSAWDESSNKAHWRKRKKGQPFFSVFNIVTTHEGQIRAAEAAFQRHLQLIPDAPRHDPLKANLPPYYPDSPVMRRDWARHADLISVMDHQAGQLLKQLADDGLAEETIVFFFSDHGAGLPRGKRWLYDSGLRVPLLVHFPKQFEALAPAKPGATTDRLVSFVDFGPTVQSLVGVEPAKHLQGVPFLGKFAGRPRQYVHGIRDRMDERYDFTRAIRDRRYKLIANFLPHLPWAQPLAYMDLMPTMREWRRLAQAGSLKPPARNFLEPTKPAWELYDLDRDPHELNNLSASAEHQEVQQRLRTALADWMQGTIDLGPVPESELADLAGKATVFEAVRGDNALYSRDVLRRFAELKERSDPRDEKNAVLRYWRVTRLGEAGDVELLKSLRNDPNASVRVAVADALARAGQPELALPMLRAELKSDNEYLRLAALNVLDRMGDKARPALADFRTALKDANQYVVRVAEHAVQTLEK